MEEIVMCTERIKFKKLQLKYAKVMVDLINNPEIYNYIHREHVDFTLGDEVKWITEHINDCIYSMFLDDEQFVGNCGFNEISDGVGTIGIFIAPEVQNQGLGFEVLTKLIDYGFNELHLEEINLDVFSHNERAIRCYRKLGFEEYKRDHDVCVRDGNKVDSIYMKIKK